MIDKEGDTDEVPALNLLNLKFIANATRVSIFSVDQPKRGTLSPAATNYTVLSSVPLPISDRKSEMTSFGG